MAVDPFGCITFHPVIDDPDLASVAGNLLPAFIALGVVALLPVAYKKLFRKTAEPIEGAAQ
ncbi:MAG: hypothetical protein AAFY85_06105 [Pseudomonadota bacterium]